MDEKRPVSVDDKKQKSVLKAFVNDNIDENDNLDAVIGQDTIMMHRPKSHRSRKERYKARRKRRKRIYIASVSIISAVAVIGSIVWYLFCPIWGYGDLSETVSADSINKARDKFTVEQYYDTKEGLLISYNIYIPFDYDSTKHYPLVVNIADDASVGSDVKKPLNSSFGGAIWATDAAQAEHPCFVIVPNYPENTMNSGIGNISRYADITERLINTVIRKYGVDATRVYGTGQDMGASMLIYLAAQDRDMFNTLLLVDDSKYTYDLSDLDENRFIYFAAGGDSDAVDHQATVKSQLIDKGKQYAEISDLDADAPVFDLNTAAENMLAEGCDHNFIVWRSGSVGPSISGGEHRASYRFGYKIDTIRDWMFK